MYKILFFFVFFPVTLLSQTTYKIKDFSKNYYAKIIIEKKQEKESGKQGTIIILEKNTKNEIIRVKSNGLNLEYSGNANCNTIPYKNQKIIIYQDFNFDGQKDFAIQNDNSACYGSASYKIFLKESTTFCLNKKFSKLADEPFCGLFEVDNEKNQLITFQKSGCCQHITTTYSVENNIPTPILIVKEEYDPNTNLKTITKQFWKNGKMQTVVQKIKSE